jgi:metallo-beta-lactamase family protein
VEGAKTVKIFREDVDVRAKVFTIGGFSAHADQKDLLDWVSNFKESKPKVFVIHGEPASSQAFADKVKNNFGFEVRVPTWRERLILKPREVISEKESVLEEQINYYDPIYNSIIDIEKELNRLKKYLKKNEQELSGNDLDRLIYILGDLRNLQN